MSKRSDSSKYNRDKKDCENKQQQQQQQQQHTSAVAQQMDKTSKTGQCNAKLSIQEHDQLRVLAQN